MMISSKVKSKRFHLAFLFLRFILALPYTERPRRDPSGLKFPLEVRTKLADRNDLP